MKTTQYVETRPEYATRSHQGMLRRLDAMTKTEGAVWQARNADFFGRWNGADWYGNNEFQFCTHACYLPEIRKTTRAKRNASK